ncbi:hypothetical protein LCGC14_1772050 [marine sediment metagenome]|uniref:Homing endonuclease LAGLIDADG domain-containing protein n=1 Tax=marine sediment metagenome TaxID=412755 RepID=A0A0F9GY00_9ZZZZ
MYEGITEIEWAQLATWLNSDGSISIQKSRPKRLGLTPIYRSRVAVSNTNRNVMDWLQTRFGGAVYLALRRPGHKPVLVWRCAAAERLALLKQALPYLIVKQDRASLAIRYEEAMTWNGKSEKGRRPSAIMPMVEQERREALYQQSLQLNRKGSVDGSY